MKAKCNPLNAQQTMTQQRGGRQKLKPIFNITFNTHHVMMKPTTKCHVGHGVTLAKGHSYQRHYQTYFTQTPVHSFRRYCGEPPLLSPASSAKPPAVAPDAKKKLQSRSPSSRDLNT